MSRRDLLRVAAALGGTVSVAALVEACSGGPGSRPAKTSTSRSVVTIEHWDYYVSQSPYMANEIKLFEAANPGIRIKRTVNANTSYDQLFTLAERGGNVPDTFISPRTIALNDQVTRGWVQPLNKWATGSWQRQFPPYSFMEGSNTFGGKIYSAPFAGIAPWLQLYVNTRVFKNAGLVNKDGSVKMPGTWDDVTRAAGAIGKKSGGTVYGLGFGNGAGSGILPYWIEVFVRAAGTPGGAISFAAPGGVGMDMRTGRYTFGSDRNYTDLIQLITQWRDNGYVYPDSTSISDEVARAHFEQGKFGMTVGGVWLQPEFTQHGFTDYQLTTLVGPGQQRKGYFYSQPGGSVWAMSSRTAHPDEAWAWLSWIYSPAAGRRWTQDYNEDLSVFPKADDPSKIKFKPFASYVALKPLTIPGPAPAVHNRDTGSVVVKSVQPDLATVLTGIYTGQIKDVQSALTDLDGRLTAELDNGIKTAQQKGYKVTADDFAFPDWDITKPYKWNIPEYMS